MYVFGSVIAGDRRRPKGTYITLFFLAVIAKVYTFKNLGDYIFLSFSLSRKTIIITVSCDEFVSEHSLVRVDRLARRINNI